MGEGAPRGAPIADPTAIRSRPRRPVSNRLNDLDSRRWLQFQKSWFLAPADQSSLYAGFVEFFTKRHRDGSPDGRPSVVLSALGKPGTRDALEAACAATGRQLLWFDPSRSLLPDPQAPAPGPQSLTPNPQPPAPSSQRLADYALIDLRGAWRDEAAAEEFLAHSRPLWAAVAAALRPNAYLTVLATNLHDRGRLIPAAWHLAQVIAQVLARKDEKVGCLPPGAGGWRPGAGEGNRPPLPAGEGGGEGCHRCGWHGAPEGMAQQPFFASDHSIFYALSFRNEPAPPPAAVCAASPPHVGPAVPSPALVTQYSVLSTQYSPPPSPGDSSLITHHSSLAPRPAVRGAVARGEGLPTPAWFVPRPPPRERDVLLHPAKFPEPMVAEFLRRFTDPGEVVLDPMLGTGSVLVACALEGRRGYGVELSPRYAAIARQRLERLTPVCDSPSPAELERGSGGEVPSAHVLIGDATRLHEVQGLPAQVDYCITSPPYWDMLKMRGAFTQRSRREQGLDVSYGDDPRDLGNVPDYERFLQLLVSVYVQVHARLRPGSFLTVVVKNVKKRGRCYLLAWDLADALAGHYALCDELIWCQDDVKLAPYGYGHAWVSNTVHHYCLNFQKAL